MLAPSLKTAVCYILRREQLLLGEKKGFFSSSSLEILLSAVSENAICIHGSRPFPCDGGESTLLVCSPLLSLPAAMLGFDFVRIPPPCLPFLPIKSERGSILGRFDENWSLLEGKREVDELKSDIQKD